MQIEQETQVILEGDCNCNHAFLTNGIGKLNLMPLIKSTLRSKWRTNANIHSIERICFNCGRLEVVNTEMNWSTPFSFAAVINRFRDKLQK